MPVPLEHQEQRWLFEWLATQRVSHPELRWVFAIPNGGKRPKGEAGRMKAEGVQRGYPDIGLDLVRGQYHGLRIELKRRRSEGGRKNGGPNPDQRLWAEHLVAQGYYHGFAYGWEEARDRLLWYIALPKPWPMEPR
jgi:hypothetical protein